MSSPKSKEKSADSSDRKVPCTKCGVMILPSTAQRNKGLCAPCAQGRPSSERRRQLPERYPCDVCGSKFPDEVLPRTNERPSNLCLQCFNEGHRVVHDFRRFLGMRICFDVAGGGTYEGEVQDVSADGLRILLYDVEYRFRRHYEKKMIPISEIGFVEVQDRHGVLSSLGTSRPRKVGDFLQLVNMRVCLDVAGGGTYEGEVEDLSDSAKHLILRDAVAEHSERENYANKSVPLDQIGAVVIKNRNGILGNELLNQKLPLNPATDTGHSCDMSNNADNRAIDLDSATKRACNRLSEDILSKYPISDVESGWKFKKTLKNSASLGGEWWSVEGVDAWGRVVSRSGANPDTLLRECVKDAIGCRWWYEGL